MSEGLKELVPGASDAEREAVEARLSHQEVAAGDVVVRAGETKTMLCYVESGRLSVAVDKDGTTIALPDVQAGDWTGGAALLAPGPASATLTAAEPTVLRTLDEPAFEALLAENPVAGSALISGLSVRLARRLRTATIPSIVEDEGGLRAEEAEAPEPEAGWVAKLFGRLLGGAS